VNTNKKSFYIDTKPYLPFLIVTTFFELILIIVSLCIPPDSEASTKEEREDEIQKQKNIYFAIEIILLLVVLFEAGTTYYILRQQGKQEVEDQVNELHEDSGPAETNKLPSLQPRPSASNNLIVQGHSVAFKRKQVSHVLTETGMLFQLFLIATAVLLAII